MGRRRISVEEHFRKYITKDKTTGCWLWTGHRHPFGYGVFTQGRNNNVAAHRVMYELVHGPLLNGSFHVLHHCDRPACCNPEHLFVGTQGDNRQDCIDKGRDARGAKQGLAKLSDEDVLTIRRLHNPQKRNGAEIARLFGLHRTNVYTIVRRKTWKHLP